MRAHRERTLRLIALLGQAYGDVFDGVAVELTVHEDALTITVKDAASDDTVEGERVYREVRRSHGSRTLRLPKGLDLDAANATFENGLLKLSMPRAEQAKPRQIPLSTVTEGPVTAVADVPVEAGVETAASA